MSLDRRKFIAWLGGGTAVTLVGKHSIDSYASSNSKSTVTRWAMVIDLKKCYENNVYDKVIEACNIEHNVPKIDNKKHEIKWIWKEKYNKAFIEQENEYLPKQYETKPVLLLCNHCDNPPCTNVCPTKATWKREDGIVMMDWHRCIGCRYCVAACPYGSRSFNYKDPRPGLDQINDRFPTRTKGVVEKCTFCASRISRGLKPSCVEVCSDSEMIFGDLNDSNSDVRKALSTRYSIRRKPELGTQPEVYYLV